MGGKITLSVEIELGWGHHDKPDGNPALSEDREVETKALRRLLAVCDEHRIPITFDIVGHLLHESCDGIHDAPIPTTGSMPIPERMSRRIPTFTHPTSSR